MKRSKEWDRREETCTDTHAVYGWFDRGGGTSSCGGGDQLAPRIRIRPPPVDGAVDDGVGVVFPCEQSLGTDNHAVSWYVTNVHTHTQ